MTIHGNAAICDVCGAGVTVTLEAFEKWETTAWQDGPETHLCGRCIERRERGILAEEFYLECVRCGRNTKDNPDIKRWHLLPRSWDDAGEADHVCAACFRPEDRLRL